MDTVTPKRRSSALSRPNHRLPAMVNFADERKRSVDTARRLIGDVTQTTKAPNLSRPASGITSTVAPKASVFEGATVHVAPKVTTTKKATHVRAATQFHVHTPKPAVPIRRPVAKPYTGGHHSVRHSAERLTVDGKVHALTEALETARRQMAKEQRRKQRKVVLVKRIALLSLAALLLAVTGYVGIDTWITNSRFKSEVFASADDGGQKTQLAANESAASTANPNAVRFAGDVKNESQPVNILANYKVAPDQPRILRIGKIGVAARILSLGEKDGAVDAPKTVYDAGWYNKSAKPGQAGAALIDGHSPETGYNFGIFSKLDRLNNGDTLTVEKGDGTSLTYKVVAKEIVPYDAVDMNKALRPASGSDQGLNIITCHGKWLDDKKTLDHRLVVYTVPA